MRKIFAQKGFSLIEIITVLVIVGILAMTAMPAYTSFIQQRAAKTAQNNLISIYNAQKNSYLNTGNYCIAGCASINNIDTNLNLNINDNYFKTYTCTATGGFQCTATNSSIGVTLTLINSPIVLAGATGCTSTTGGLPCNPYCTPAGPYCPN